MLTVQDVYNLNEGLNVINEKELPIPVALKLQRNALKVAQEQQIAGELRKKIIEKYKDKTLDNGNIKIKKDKLDLFNKEIKELMEQEVKLELETVDPTDLGETIQPRVLIQLDKILKEEKQ